MSDLWAGFDDVANNPADMAARTQLLERANTVAENFNNTATKLVHHRADTLSELIATTAEINSTAVEIAQLNQAIKANTIADVPANDLGTSDLLVTKLAGLTGAIVRDGDFGQIHVVLNGTALGAEQSGAKPAARHHGPDGGVPLGEQQLARDGHHRQGRRPAAARPTSRSPRTSRASRAVRDIAARSGELGSVRSPVRSPPPTATKTQPATCSSR